MTTKKSLNFEMLRRKWPEIADLGAMAERYVHADPETALVKMRNMIELVVRWLYRQERLPQGFRPNLFDLIKGDAFQSIMPPVVLEKLDILRQFGNKAAHGDKCNAKDATWLLQEAWLVSSWIYVRYDGGNQQECGRVTLPPVEAPDLSAGALKK